MVCFFHLISNFFFTTNRTPSSSATASMDSSLFNLLPDFQVRTPLVEDMIWGVALIAFVVRLPLVGLAQTYSLIEPTAGLRRLSS
jgi:hypothetical protein